MSPVALLLSCVVMLNTATGQASRTGERCDTALSPASTFKIPHALVALEIGVVETDTVEKWDGAAHPAQPLWDADHTVLSAMRPSVLWFFQRIAPRIGAARMQEWLRRFDYGNADTSGPISAYWVNGRLRISPNQQVRFLERFYAGHLPVAAAHLRDVQQALAQRPGTVQNARGAHPWAAPWPDGVELNAKTGATTVADGESVSWLVGQLRFGGARYVFASAVWRDRGGVDGLDGARAAERAFRAKGILQ